MTKPPTDMRQFVCPECDHTIFNRRLPDCEKCGALLPEALRYSEQHLAAIAKEQATQQKRKKRRSRRRPPDPGWEANEVSGTRGVEGMVACLRAQPVLALLKKGSEPPNQASLKEQLRPYTLGGLFDE